MLRCLLGPLSNGEAPRFSSLVQVDAAAGVEEVDEVGSGVFRCADAWLKTRRQRGRVKRDPWPYL